MSFLNLQHTPDKALREEIIRTALKMNRLGINQGKSGNVSARVSDPNVAYLITPTGVPYDDTRPEQIVAMRPDGTFDGDTLPSSEWRFHHDIYAARSDVNAVVHTHSPYATTLACMDRAIPPFHYMVAVAGGKDIRCAPYATFGTQARSDFAVAALHDRTAGLLSHHGMIACGVNLEKALALAVEVESLARMFWQALQIGEPTQLTDAEMANVLEKFKSYGQQHVAGK